MRILSIAVCLGFIVALKRLWLGLFLGRKTYSTYVDVFETSQAAITNLVLTYSYLVILKLIMPKI